MVGRNIAHYRILEKLGEGGMGVVWAAQDERLHRRVAIKMLRPAGIDEQARSRFWREARVAAAVNHPNVCQIYEIGEEAGELFIAMELLDGESLAPVLARGALPVSEAIDIMLSILGALDVLHQRGLVHRDLKPSNIHRTSHGVKLLDFGLARGLPSLANEDAKTATVITLTEGMAGTPHYMSPEQMQGQPADERSDVFAAGAILFEMLSGRRAFAGRSLGEVFHAVTFEQPPALAGSSVIAAVDRIIHRALTKRPDDRYASAEAMAQDLRQTMLLSDTGAPVRARPMTRLIVLPFRMLRPDPDTDFLAFSLPDAITASLSGLESILVRSSLVAARFAGQVTDLKAIATEAEVDMVLTGTLLRSGDQLRVSTQLAEAPSGTLIWSQTSQLPLQDVFQLQDQIVARALESLAPSLTAREQRLLRHDVPATAKAYECYLRANQLGARELSVARDLYLRCVEEDPHYAPAWARLARCYRVIGKFGEAPVENLARAESAFERALSLNPDLALAHNLYAHLEAERGRAQEAMTRLLGRARAKPNDPELFAGLVYVCRYCGLLEASVAAHLQARRLDPNIGTTVMHSYFMLGDYERALSHADEFRWLSVVCFLTMGRPSDALAALREMEQAPLLPLFRSSMASLRAQAEGRLEASLAAAREFSSDLGDPEGLFYSGRQFARLGATGEALEMLGRVVEGGYWCYPALLRDPWLNGLRAEPEFARILGVAEERFRASEAAFVAAGGEAVLGLSARMR